MKAFDLLALAMAFYTRPTYSLYLRGMTDRHVEFEILIERMGLWSYISSET